MTDQPVTVVSALEGHRLWAQTYDSEINPLLALEHRTLLAHLGRLQHKRFLDVGCGTGRWMATALSLGAAAIGIDASADMLKRAQAKPRLAGRLAKGDAVKLPVRDACVDLALCSFTLGYAETLGGLVSELARVVKGGGRVVLSDVHPSAFERGWRSAFRIGTDVYQIERRVYSMGELLRESENAGLRLVRLIEPALGEPEREIFVRAGKQKEFETARGRPAVWAGIWEHPPR